MKVVPNLELWAFVSDCIKEVTCRTIIPLQVKKIKRDFTICFDADYISKHIARKLEGSKWIKEKI